MEKYNLHMRHEVFDRVSKCMSAHIESDKWFPVKVLGDLMEVDLSGIFGNGNLGWSPSTLLYYCQSAETTFSMCLSLPKPEEIPCTDSPSQVDPVDSMLISLRHATCFLRNWADADKRLIMPAELINQLSEMRTLIHALIGTGENCCDEPAHEYVEAIRKTTSLDAMDAFSYALKALLERKGSPGVKRALNSIYGTAAYADTRLADAFKRAATASQEGLRDAINGSSGDAGVDHRDQCECENVKADEPNALFVTIETGMLEATPENVAAVSSFISNAGEGRDIHFRIV